MSDFTTTKVPGSDLLSEEWNQLADLDQLVTDSGQTPSTGTLDQISKASAHFAAVSTFYSESGAADTYVLAAISPFKAPTSYQNGMLVRFRASNANTGASTINVNGLGTKSIKLYDGTTDPAAGDISTVVDTVLRFDSANDCFVKNEIFIPQASGVAYFNNGIRLSSSSSAVLDEYEEGTFTPTLYGSSTPGSPTYSNQVGRYTRIGRFVSGAFYLLLTSRGGLTGQVRMDGLPYNVENSTAARYQAILSSFTSNYDISGVSNYTGVSGAVINNTNDIYFHVNTATGGAISLTESRIADNFSLYCTFMYNT